MKPATRKQAKPHQRYNEEELSLLREICCKLAGTEIFNYSEGGSLWRRLHGLVADTPISPLLRMTDDVLATHGMELPSDAQTNVLKKLGVHLAFSIRDNDAELFEQLAIVLRARRENRPIHSLKARELRIRQGPGRKPAMLDLSRAFPLALLGVTMRRSRDHAQAGEFTDEKITRTELLKAIQREQQNSGMKTPSEISQSELSRWISAFNFQRFMAEQPIAHKRPKEV